MAGAPPMGGFPGQGEGGGFSLLDLLYSIGDWSNNFQRDIINTPRDLIESANQLAGDNDPSRRFSLEDLSNDVGQGAYGMVQGVSDRWDPRNLGTNFREHPGLLAMDLAGFYGTAAGLGRLGRGRGFDAAETPSRRITASGRDVQAESRLSDAAEAAAQDDFVANLTRAADREASRIKGTDPRLSPLVDRIGRGTRPMPETLERLIREERGGTAGPDPAGVMGEAFDTSIKQYGKNRQPEMRGAIEERTPADLSPEGQRIRAALEGTFLNEEPRQAPTLGPREAARAARADRQLKGIQRLMEEEDFTGNQPKLNARGGEDVGSGLRSPGRARSEGSVDPYEALSARRSGSTNTRYNNVDEAVDYPRDIRAAGERERIRDVGDEYEGVLGANLRNTMANEPLPEEWRYYAHETDLKNVPSIRKKGIENRFDPAEEGRRFVSARDWAEGEIPEGRARIKFRAKDEPQRRPNLSAVKFERAISPEDIVDIQFADRSTLARLAEETRRGGRELDPDFETKASPAKARRRVPKRPQAPRPVPKNYSGPTPSELRGSQR